jgi:hypothetical protein
MYTIFLRISPLLNCEIMALFVVRTHTLVSTALFYILLQMTGLSGLSFLNTNSLSLSHRFAAATGRLLGIVRYISSNAIHVHPVAMRFSHRN